jgi:hypothetical protein
MRACVPMQAGTVGRSAVHVMIATPICHPVDKFAFLPAFLKVPSHTDQAYFCQFL